MNQLPDPIGGKGYANVLPPMNIPKFDNIAALQGQTNSLALQAAKLGADQKAKADALAQEKAKLDKAAADKAAADKANQTVNMFKVLEQTPLSLLPSAQEWSAQEVARINKMGQELLNKGIDINSPEAAQYRQEAQMYHAAYLQEHENAKAFYEKKKVYDTDPFKFDQYNAVEDVAGYDAWVKGGRKGQFLFKGLSPRIEELDSKKYHDYTGSLIPRDKTTDIAFNKGKQVGTERYYPKTTEEAARTYAPLINEINRLQESQQELTYEDKQRLKSHKMEAERLGALEPDGKINPTLFAQKYDETYKPGVVKDFETQTVWKPESGDGGGNNFGWNGGVFVMGRKGKTASLAPADTRIDAGGQFTSNWSGFTPPSADFSNFPVVATLSVPNENVIALNQLPENVAFDFSGGVAKPIKSKSFGNGGVKQDQLLVLPSLGDVPLNKTQLEEAKAKGLPIVYKSYKKTTTEVKDENDNKVEKEVLLDVSAISKADFNNMKVASEFGQQTIDELHQRNGTKTQTPQPQTPQNNKGKLSNNQEPE